MNYMTINRCTMRASIRQDFFEVRFFVRYTTLPCNFVLAVLMLWRILLINYVALPATKRALKLLPPSISRQQRELGSLMRSETT